MRKQTCITIILVLFTLIVKAQQKGELKLPEPKRFISKIEVFAGPSLSFNHGNMFVDNYRGEYAGGNYVQNKRLMKMGYSIGAGVYHPLKNWLDINVSISWEQKGSKSKLDHPLNPVNNDDREIEKTEYTYNYLTLNLAPKFYFGKRKLYSIMIGGYYSKIQGVKGHTTFLPEGGAAVETSFRGRYVNGFADDGGIDKVSFAPGLSSFQKDDYGITIGVAYSLPIKGKHSISFQLIDKYGLRDINKKVFAPFLPDQVEKNHTLSLSIGYVLERSTPNQK